MISVSLLFAQLQLEVAYPNLSFQWPVNFQFAKDNSNRIFIVEQQGKIWVFENSKSVSNPELFLDISDLVDASVNEMGLLGLAFHPNYKKYGFFM